MEKDGLRCSRGGAIVKVELGPAWVMRLDEEPGSESSGKAAAAGMKSMNTGNRASPTTIAGTAALQRSHGHVDVSRGPMENTR